MTTPTREQIEAASFDAYEIQKLAFAKHGVTLDNPFYEDMYTAGFEAGVKWLLQYKEHWQREAWEAARKINILRHASVHGVREYAEGPTYKTFEDWKKSQISSDIMAKEQNLNK